MPRNPSVGAGRSPAWPAHVGVARMIGMMLVPLALVSLSAIEAGRAGAVPAGATTSWEHCVLPPTRHLNFSEPCAAPRALQHRAAEDRFVSGITRATRQREHGHTEQADAQTADCHNRDIRRE